jgi:hypothetical protein
MIQCQKILLFLHDQLIRRKHVWKTRATVWMYSELFEP